MLHIPSRVLILLFAVANGAAVAYLLIGWGVVPMPVDGYGPMATVTALSSLSLCTTGWIMLFKKSRGMRRG